MDAVPDVHHREAVSGALDLTTETSPHFAVFRLLLPVSGWEVPRGLTVVVQTAHDGLVTLCVGEEYERRTEDGFTVIYAAATELDDGEHGQSTYALSGRSDTVSVGVYTDMRVGASYVTSNGSIVRLDEEQPYDDDAPYTEYTVLFDCSGVVAAESAHALVVPEAKLSACLDPGEELDGCVPDVRTGCECTNDAGERMQLRNVPVYATGTLTRCAWCSAPVLCTYCGIAPCAVREDLCSVCLAA